MSLDDLVMDVAVEETPGNGSFVIAGGGSDVKLIFLLEIHPGVK